MSELEKEITGIKRQLCCLRGDIKELQDLIGDGVGFEQAENFSALPPAADNNGKYYHVLNSQGTKWLPGWVGGTFYSKGFYYSDGVDWVFVGDVPYNATQTEVNTGTNTTQFVTPATLANYDSWGDEIEEVGGDAKLYASKLADKLGVNLEVCDDGTYDVYVPTKALFNFRENNVAYYLPTTKEKGITSFEQSLKIVI